MSSSDFSSSPPAIASVAPASVSPPVPSSACASRLRPCVLAIGIDGCRPDCITQELTPTIWNMIHKPNVGTSTAYSLCSQVGDICWSGPGWSSCCTGVWRDKHGVCGNHFNTKQFDKYPSFFQRLKAARPETVTACSINWRPLSEEILGPCDYANIHDDDDVNIVRSACSVLKEQAQVDCLFVHLDDVDAAGHNFDFGPQFKEYREAVHVADERIAEILSALYARPTFEQEDWLILLTTDHGGMDKTHGDGRIENRTNFVIISGRDAVPGEIYPSPLIVDVAPTILAHLNVKINSSWHLDGRPVGLKLRNKGHFLDLKSSQDPENKWPVPLEN